MCPVAAFAVCPGGGGGAASETEVEVLDSAEGRAAQECEGKHHGLVDSCPRQLKAGA